MADHDVFRDGRVHLCADLCSTCVFRPGNLMDLKPGRLRGMVDSAIEDGSAIVCHRTLETYAGRQTGNAVCRGFWDRHQSTVDLLVLAERIGVVTEVDPG